MKSAAVPLFAGVHDSPASSLRKTPAAEMPTYIVWSFAGSNWIECVHIPPAPGFQRSRVGWSIRLMTGSQLSPRSAERKRTPGAPPSHSVPLGPGSTCHVFSSVSS